MRKNIHPLRALRVALACVFILGITLLLVDATTFRHVFGWMAKIQLWPSFLGWSVFSLLIIALLTILLGRIYCSIICPLGIWQDIFIRLGNIKWMKKINNHLGPNRFRPTAENKKLRYIVFLLFIGLSFAPITAVYAHFLEPYSLYGKMIAAVTSNAYTWVAYCIVALFTFVISLVAFLRGREWCNSICPVGTLLSLFSRFAFIRPVIDSNQCNGCQKCARNCKAECIDPINHLVDMTRCVDCFDCLDNCSQEAIHLRFGLPKKQTKKVEKKAEEKPANQSRRQFLATSAFLTATGLVSAARHKTDGGLAAIEQKIIPQRANRLLPAGAQSLRRFQQHCTACQLCVSACPQHVLRPSMDASHLMLPQMQFDISYCPPTCHACADVCPTGAITPYSPAAKTAIQIGHAVWIRENCVVLRDGVSCGNCQRHCPADAIQMVEIDGSQFPVPAIDTEKCIGCGHCEYVCPSRPLSAIYIEGHETHRMI